MGWDDSWEGVVGAREGDPRRLVAVLDAVADAYGDMIVDCPAGLRADIGVPLLAADACVLVTALDRGALAVELDAGLAGVAYNRVERASDEVVNVLDAPVVAIPEDEAVTAALDAGRLVRAAPGETTAGERFAALAERVRRTA